MLITNLEICPKDWHHGSVNKARRLRQEQWIKKRCTFVGEGIQSNVWHGKRCGHLPH